MEFEKKNEIGFRIQKLRKERNISQETMGEMLDIHANNISKIETGRSALKLDTLIKIADYFEVTLDTLSCQKRISIKLSKPCKPWYIYF